MNQIHFVRREVRRMGTEHLINLIPILQMYFQVELRLGISQFLPRIPNMPRLLFRGLLRRMPKHNGAGLQLVAARRMPSQYRWQPLPPAEWSSRAFPPSTAPAKTDCCSMLPKQLVGFQIRIRPRPRAAKGGRAAQPHRASPVSPGPERCQVVQGVDDCSQAPECFPAGRPPLPALVRFPIRRLN